VPVTVVVLRDCGLRGRGITWPDRVHHDVPERFLGVDEHQHRRRLRLLLVLLLGSREEVVEHPGQRMAAAVAVVHRDQHLHRRRSLSDSRRGSFSSLLDGIVLTCCAIYYTGAVSG
jgi:hypothetical protein